MASFLKKHYALDMNLFTYPYIVEFMTFYEFVNNGKVKFFAFISLASFNLQSPIVSANNTQHIILGYGISAGIINRLDGPVRRRLKGIFHLHGLKDDHCIPFAYRISHLL